MRLLRRKDRLPLGNIAEIKQGASISHENVLNNKFGGAAILRSRDINTHKIESLKYLMRVDLLKDELLSHEVKNGDILFNVKDRSCIASRFEGTKEIPVIASSSVIVVRCRLNCEIDSSYLHWYITQPSVQYELASRIEFEETLTSEILRDFYIYNAPENIQKQVVEIAELATKEAEISRINAEKRRQLTNLELMARLNLRGPISWQ